MSLGLIMTCRALNFPCHIRDEAEPGQAAAFSSEEGGSPFSDSSPATLPLPLVTPPCSDTVLINSGHFLKGQVLGQRDGRVSPPQSHGKHARPLGSSAVCTQGRQMPWRSARTIR